MASGGYVVEEVSSTAGTVTSVGLLLPPSVFADGSGPVTTAGTLSAYFINQGANSVFAGPVSGGSNTPAFRGLVAADIPALSYVTSVALSLPSIFSVSGSPVSGSGTLTGSLVVQNQNKIFSGPASGADASPTFRLLVAADIPDLSATYASLSANNVFTATGYIQIPSGTTGQQPGSPANGMIRYNTTTARFEFYNGAWINYVKLTGDTMTGDLTVPNINITTALKLLDTTQKIAMDVSSATILRIGNGFAGVLFPKDLWFSSGAGIMDANGVYLISFPAAVAGATNYISVTNANATAPIISSVGTNAALTIQAIGAGLMKVSAGSGATIGITPTGAGLVTVGIGSTVIFRDTNAGSNLNADINFNMAVSTSTAGVVTSAFNNNVVGSELSWFVGNGSRRIATAGIRIGNITTTAASEASDLLFYTMTGGASRALRFTIGATALTANNVDFKLSTAGNGIYIKEGTNATMGSGTLAGGTLVVNTTKVTASSRIFLTDSGGGVLANIGSLYISARTAGTSFTVSSSNALDTSTFSWMIVEPA